MKVPAALLLHMGNIVPLHSPTQDITNALEEVHFSPKQTLRRFVCAMAEVKIKKHVHYVLIWLLAKLPLFPSLDGA